MEIFRYLLGTRAPAAPKSVLAFSTIITMLTHTNRGQRLDNFGSPKEIGLGVLDALAVVIATGFEVVAVISTDHNNPRHLEVVIVFRSDSNHLKARRYHNSKGIENTEPY